MMKNKLMALAFLSLTIIYPAHGQSGKVFTASDYQRAANMLAGNTNKLVDNNIRPQWLPDGRLWYRTFTENKAEYKMFNPADGKKLVAPSRKELFEKASLALPDTNRRDKEVFSPDGKYSVLLRDWNLWIKDVAKGTEKPLTTDGSKNFGYATDNAGWTHSDKPVVSWSPDSKRIATFQQDQRHVSTMYLVKTKVGAPELEEWKYPLPSDSTIIRIHRVIIDISAEPKIIRLKMGPDSRRASLLDDILSDGALVDVAWSEDSKQLAFVSTDYVVREILHVDQKKRLIYFTGGGREANNNPYFRYLYSVDFSGKNLKLLTPNVGDHAVSFSRIKIILLTPIQCPTSRQYVKCET